MEAISKAISKVIEVKIGDEKIKVEKLALGKYAKLLIALKNLPKSAIKDIQNLDTDDNEGSILFLIGLFGEAWEQIVEIISIGSGVDKDRLMNDSSIGLEGGIELFLAIYEVNNLKNVVQSVKNALTRGKV